MFYRLDFGTDRLEFYQLNFGRDRLDVFIDSILVGIDSMCFIDSILVGIDSMCVGIESSTSSGKDRLDVIDLVGGD